MITLAMPPKRSTRRPRPYGKQAVGRTIKSVSIDQTLADWAERQAEARGIPFSSFISDVVAEYKATKENEKK